MIPAALKTLIRNAFATVEYPGDARLISSDEGNEPREVQLAFLGKRDWTTLAPEFLDAAPDGLSSALSFFSEAAFRFYTPAFMIADIDQLLGRANPVFHLYSGLTDHKRNEQVNPYRYGKLTWFEVMSKRHALFTSAEATAIIEFLRFAAERSDFDRKLIDQSLRNYWLVRDELEPLRTNRTR
ncbi:MAG: DUF6714 family protein [Planctomycetota bacterium]|mgnify:CR=1 FL=1